MGHLYKDEAYRATLIDKGFERAKQFSWKQSGDRLNEIFRAVSG
jgi:hypothetical protein